MEEVGKYQSIQDRIKRLTKNQTSSSAVSPNQKLDILVTNSPSAEDSQKQNLTRMNFAKKRQNSQNHLRTISTTRQYAMNNQTAFQPTTNLLGENRYHLNQQRVNQLTQIPNQCIAKWNNKDSFQENCNQWNTNSYSMKRKERNDSVGNLMDKSSSYFIEKHLTKKLPTEFSDCGYPYNQSFLLGGSQQNQSTKRVQGIRKNHKNPTAIRRQYGNLTIRQSFQDQGIERVIRAQMPGLNRQYVLEKKTIKQIKSTQAQNQQLQRTEMRSRMITRCKSGIIERIPGRIIKNK